ncbi:hypothetical protein PsorP6_018230 [Peronosclerospora sorghi]|uniref:Uncharacterized protein n=1 Tax=Peronosclerospora sorghi TaxID=230839 RepID=A0ACC0WE37_9STRA|nr:hypothetical protein PsorP6_018230 [Peronosclerospora sorghi]
MQHATANASQEFQKTYGAGLLLLLECLVTFLVCKLKMFVYYDADINCFKLPSGVSDFKALIGVETIVSVLKLKLTMSSFEVLVLSGCKLLTGASCVALKSNRS